MKKEIGIGIGASLLTVIILAGLFIVFSGTNQIEYSTSKASFDRVVPESIDVGDSADTMLSYSYSLKLEVDSIISTESSIIQLATELGGYVYGASGDYEKSKSLVLNIKVPADSAESFISSLEILGEKKSETMNAQDVKSSYDDVTARLNSLNAEKIRLVELFDQAEETADLVDISSRLSYVDSQITYLELRKTSIENSVELASFSIRLDEKMNPVSRFVLVELTELVDTFSDGLNQALKIIAASAGFLIPALVLGLIAIVLKKKRKKKKKR